MDKVRAPDFAERLEKACIDHPHCPTDAYRGKQKWLREKLEERGTEFRASPEALRKWFAGETRPRPKMLKAIATVLQVDEAWLSLGVAPELTPRERKKRAKAAEGGAMLLAGLIQISGGSSTFPELGEVGRPDIIAIIDGEAVEIDAPLAKAIRPGVYSFMAKREHKGRRVVAIIPHGFGAQLVLIPQKVIEDKGERIGDHIEITASEAEGRFTVGSIRLPEIAHLEDLVEHGPI